jgi:hypothetical protein
MGSAMMRWAIAIVCHPDRRVRGVAAQAGADERRVRVALRSHAGANG